MAPPTRKKPKPGLFRTQARQPPVRCSSPSARRISEFGSNVECIINVHLKLVDWPGVPYLCTMTANPFSWSLGAVPNKSLDLPRAFSSDLSPWPCSSPGHSRAASRSPDRSALTRSRGATPKSHCAKSSLSRSLPLQPYRRAKSTLPGSAKKVGGGATPKMSTRGCPPAPFPAPPSAARTATPQK